jgi:hypothetical protein
MNNSFPKDILHLILDFSGAIKWRHGKYMNQIPKSDERYEIMKTIPLKKEHSFSQFILMNDGRVVKYILYHVIVRLDRKTQFNFQIMSSTNEEIDLDEFPICFVREENNFFYQDCIRGCFVYNLSKNMNSMKKNHLVIS